MKIKSVTMYQVGDTLYKDENAANDALREAEYKTVSLSVATTSMWLSEEATKAVGPVISIKDLLELLGTIESDDLQIYLKDVLEDYHE
jgi:hypothetical protein